MDRVLPGFLTLLSLFLPDTFSPAFATGMTPEPLPRCRDLLVPLLGDQIQVLPLKAYERIRAHSLSTLARELHERGVQLEFAHSILWGGYLVQGTMVERILKEVFPDSFREPNPFRTTERIRITLYDSPLNEYWWRPLARSETWIDPLVLEMSRLKAGNPLLTPLEQEMVRQKLGIPERSRVLHAYLNASGMDTFIDLHRYTPEKPDYIILSFNKNLPRDSDLNRLEGYPSLRLSALPETLPSRAVLINDTRHRMLELYAAADYAFVIGANNLFEPLQLRCPVLFFKNRWPFLLTSIGSPVGYYHPEEWNRLTALAERTGGGIGIHSVSQAPAAIRKLLSIQKNRIQSPAFLPFEPGGREAFDLVLDALEASIRAQLVERP